MKKIIALDAGHGPISGGRTPIFQNGPYTGTYMHEREYNKAVVDYMTLMLEKNNYLVLNVADSDTDIPLATRTSLANNHITNKYNKPADLYVSIHANAITGQWQQASGLETFIMQGLLDTQNETKRLGEITHKHLIKVANGSMRDRGLKQNNFHVLRETHMPAILIEGGFMDNFNDAMLLKSEDFRYECAEQLVKGICEYYGTTYVSNTIKNNDIYLHEIEQNNKQHSNTFDTRSIEILDNDIKIFLDDKWIGVGLLYKGTSFMPVRVLCNALGITDITWNGDTHTVSIKTKT